MEVKRIIYNRFLELITEKISGLEKVLVDLKESGANETKSTAGDKHETALAMLQIEQANTRAQLEELLKQKAILARINPSISATVVVLGTLIHSNRGIFFMSTALGKLEVDGMIIFSLSPQSPLGQKMMGLKSGDSVSFNGTDYFITQIN